jgi:chromosome segregation ATPase
MDLFNFNSDILLYLVTTAISVIIFLFGYIAFDKNKREGPLIAKINKLEKELLIILKENEILQGKISTDSGFETNDPVSNEVVENLKSDLLEMIDVKNALEEQVQSLEKELENSTEVGMELNRMLTEILSSESGRDVIKANVEHLQRQLVEQQSTITSVNETLAVTNTENHELRLELDLSNKKVLDLQAELDKLLLNVLKIEEEKETQQSSLESEMSACRQKYEEMISKLKAKEEECGTELKQLKNSLDQTQRKLEFKIKEHDLITDSVRQLKVIKSKDDSIVQNLLEVSGIKAELQMVKTENQRLSEKLQQEQEMKLGFEKRAQVVNDEIHLLREKYDEADKLRVETQTKLEVLSNYFKDREAQWQKEISKHEALWAEKQGEATSTTERIKFMQEQLHNYKTQTESLKQEIMSQEIELKSQISVLEKKAHENWVSARQAERKLEETKQEAAQLRHRLTLRERAIQEDKNQHRLQSPIEQNGDMPISPLESPASPPLLYGTRDHITKSPPIPGLPPFMPPPPGVPFMPPPLHGVPPFIPPPPPNMFPGDHRPPPLGRMSSPPLNSRYSPSSRGYSPYDRNSSSPSDSEYGTSPPRRRGYSPFNNRDEERRDYKRPPPGRSNGRNIMKGENIRTSRKSF